MSWFYDKQATFKNADGDIDSDGLYSNCVEYEIKNIVDWDDYYIVLIKAVQ